MELQTGMKIAAHAGILGMIYSYTGSKHVKQAENQAIGIQTCITENNSQSMSWDMHDNGILFAVQ